MARRPPTTAQEGSPHPASQETPPTQARVVVTAMAEQRNLLHEIADLADELTDARHNVERITDTDRHRHKRQRRIWTTNHPSLLQQLEYAVEPEEPLQETEKPTGGGASFEPRPAARLEAISELQRIQRETAAWCERAGISVRATPTGNVRA